MNAIMSLIREYCPKRLIWLVLGIVGLAWLGLSAYASLGARLTILEFGSLSTSGKLDSINSSLSRIEVATDATRKEVGDLKLSLIKR